jgi:hypothetical protein
MGQEDSLVVTMHHYYLMTCKLTSKFRKTIFLLWQLCYLNLRPLSGFLFRLKKWFSNHFFLWLVLNPIKYNPWRVYFCLYQRLSTPNVSRLGGHKPQWTTDHHYSPLFYVPLTHTRNSSDSQVPVTHASNPSYLEAEIKKIVVQGQPVKIIHESLSPK